MGYQGRREAPTLLPKPPRPLRRTPTSLVMMQKCVAETVI